MPMKRERQDLARLVGKSVEWLMTGTEPVGGDEARVAADLGDAAHEQRQVPVISWSHAGEATTYEELPKHWQGRAPTSSTNSKAFAVIVEGDCMEPKALPGDRVIVEPGGDLRNGRAVVAKLADDGVQLRIYTKLANGMIRLASMKPEIYPTMDYKTADFHWIYPVRELVRTL